MPPPIDQVIRREQFERAHPDVTFWFSGVHRATVRRSGTTHELAEGALRALLDRLDVIVAGGDADRSWSVWRDETTEPLHEVGQREDAERILLGYVDHDYLYIESPAGEQYAWNHFRQRWERL